MDKRKDEELEKFLWSAYESMTIHPVHSTVRGRLVDAMAHDGFIPVSGVNWKSFRSTQYVLMVGQGGNALRIYYLTYRQNGLSEVAYSERSGRDE